MKNTNGNEHELRSWFEANAQFPSTTPAAHMNYSAGGYLSLTMTYPILQCSCMEELTAFLL